MESDDESASIPDRIIDKSDLGKMIPYTPQHILRMEKAGQFPRRVQLGPNRVGWVLSEVTAWIDERKRARRTPLPKQNPPQESQPQV